MLANGAGVVIETAGWVPVPVRNTFWGVLAASSLKLSVAVLTTGLAGANVTTAVQLAPGATVPPVTQVLDGAIAKSLGLGAIDSPLNVIGAPPELVSLNVFAALVVPTSTDPKSDGVADDVAGVTVAAGTL
jgi:hypothetical protein